MQNLMRAFALFIVPAVLLAAGFAFVFYSSALPPSLAGLKIYGPYLLFVLGATLAGSFNRGRALLALVLLVGVYAAQQLWLQQSLETPVSRAVYAGLTVFVPLNLALLALLPERGAFNRHVALPLAAIALEILFVAWAATTSRAGAVDWAYFELLIPAPFSIGLIPQPGTLLIGLALMVTTAATLVTRSATPAALAGATIAFTVAIHAPAVSLGFATFISVAELMITIAVLQDTFRMAFRDELTTLPSRRALNERLASLGKYYAIAMLDVDHFKNFNDTHGHDVGDQVLKMVAARLGDVGGGGKAYRYGGEEFTIVFPGKGIAEALPYLESLRAEIESYRLALRGSDRPQKAKENNRQRGGWRGKDNVSVTISIGVAERNDRLANPQAVIEAADRALYRAKQKGRNLVSR